jgi:hypothetical protein
MDRSILKLLTLTVLVLIAVAAAWEAHSGEGGVEQRIRNARQPVKAGLPTPPVVGPVVLVDSHSTGKAFWTETRKERIGRFKCSQCHNEQSVTEANAAAIAHGDIRLVHGSGDKQLSCYSCHNRQERDYLSSAADERIDMDHSYELCGQCHFRQKKDWAGGAHGKRVAAWSGERVVKTCTACHNPHTPRFQKRWPVTYSPANQK